jgi:hypothetical protein
MTFLRGPAAELGKGSKAQDPKGRESPATSMIRLTADRIGRRIVARGAICSQMEASDLSIHIRRELCDWE